MPRGRSGAARSRADRSRSAARDRLGTRQPDFPASASAAQYACAVVSKIEISSCREGRRQSSKPPNDRSAQAWFAPSNVSCYAVSDCWHTRPVTRSSTSPRLVVSKLRGVGSPGGALGMGQVAPFTRKRRSLGRCRTRRPLLAQARACRRGSPRCCAPPPGGHSAGTGGAPIQMGSPSEGRR